MSLEEIYKWLANIHKAHPPFDFKNWQPISVRYQHLTVKVLWRTDLEELYKLPTFDRMCKSE